MKWFEGSIGEAVSTSKTQNAVFVVYIEGSDELSKIMSAALDSVAVSEKLESRKFVCIKLVKDSEGHMQFSEIYKVVPVPSLFLIGDNGLPLEVIPGETNQENVTKRISTAVSKLLGEPSSEQSASVSSVDPPTEPVISTPPVQSAPPEEPSQTSSQADVQELLKKKRDEIKKKEEEREKEAELKRRHQGQEMAIARRQQQERELEELRRERERDKREEAAARERVLQQIREDREMRLSRQGAQPSSPPAEEASSPPRPSSPSSTDTRIQFKLPDCQTRTHTFSRSNTVQDLRNFIDANIKLPFNEYTLATTFPRREFTVRDLNRDLESLELVPSGVVLIMPLSHGVVSTRVNWASAVWAMLWDLMQPLFSAGRYLRSWISGEPSTADGPLGSMPSAAPPPSTTESPETTTSTSKPAYPSVNASSGRTVRRRGNIHTLHDGDDSNDENNTWNGNSTQLM